MPYKTPLRTFLAATVFQHLQSQAIVLPPDRDLLYVLTRFFVLEATRVELGVIDDP
jgi:hypothetical protein